MRVLPLSKNQNDDSMYFISCTKMMQYKHHTSIKRLFDISKINNCWYQKKGITQSSTFGSYASPKINNFGSYFDDENNFDIIDIINNNENEHIYLFDEIFGNNDKNGW